MYSSFLGIDVSKASFDVALLINSKIKTKKFNNNPRGFLELTKWLQNKEASSMHACMEATGGYEKKLAGYLYDNKINVSVVNPARVKGFSISRLCRVKTDKADCELIAYFCQAMQPDLWQPTPQHVQELQQWIKRLDSLINIRTQEINRLESSEGQVARHIKKHLEFLEQQIDEVQRLVSEHIKNYSDLSNKDVLLASIPGIGEKTRATIIAFLNIDNFSSAKQIAAYVGLNPRHKQSGSSVHGISRISKTGDSNLRKAFYMPAIASIRFNPVIKEFADRLSDAGKPKMVILIAAMRKLVHIIYGVLKNNICFDPNFMKFSEKIIEKDIAI